MLTFQWRPNPDQGRDSETRPNPAPRLDEFDQDEWRDVTRIVRPDWTEEQFEKAWNAFQEMKRRRSLQ